ncbi:hypothetical protein Nepgr_021613 [Nepenthes gracilis]|uniref:Uncharacterized protein n=1 Tax=Nepenthes gracilis TaxID=150966 RepID=A0AAD3XXJ4_NEPGR|nr:hypothetical protein Nepgr_021612 [Nepenthes gracilis]GMH19772.1 hypothetical protein Nepgr_021613 [Nepenthes gracilis]
MRFDRRCSILVLILLVALAAFSSIGAARPLPEDLKVANANSNGLSVHDSVFETTKHNIAYWLQRLSSGPSDGGGH